MAAKRGMVSISKYRKDRMLEMTFLKSRVQKYISVIYGVEMIVSHASLFSNATT